MNNYTQIPQPDGDYRVTGRVSGHSQAEKEAHERLIAAELLASLRDMLDWLDDGNRVLSDSCAVDVSKARAAIAKATGGDL